MIHKQKRSSVFNAQRYKGTALNGHEIHRKEYDLEVIGRVSNTLLHLASPDGVFEQQSF
jgi:hypothetical protein